MESSSQNQVLNKILASITKEYNEIHRPLIDRLLLANDAQSLDDLYQAFLRLEICLSKLQKTTTHEHHSHEEEECEERIKLLTREIRKLQETIRTQDSEKMVQALLKTVRIEIDRQNVSPQVELILDNLSSLTDILETQVIELQKEARVKDQQIQNLTEEVGTLKGKEEAKVIFAHMFQEMRHQHSQPCHQDEKEQIRQLQAKIEELTIKDFENSQQLNELQQRTAQLTNIQIDQEQQIRDLQSRLQERAQVVTISNSDDDWEALTGSQCSQNQRERGFLKRLCFEKLFTLKLLFRGSENDWSNQKFHFFCNGKSPMLQLMKIQNGPCVGGFTQAQLSSPFIPDQLIDPESFLFNLTDQRVFQCNHPEQRGVWDSLAGPCFGDEELCTHNRSLHRGISKHSKKTYCIPTDENGRNMLTNQLEEEFPIEEVEIWQIVPKINISSQQVAK